MKTELFVLRGLFLIAMATVVTGFGSFVRAVEAPAAHVVQASSADAGAVRAG
ncbi:hypothetical protein [Dokdonella koreensis]|uniref:Uncharacterized protein n=1 Tax=Dokdonella koreensis DS-123 TaxID=1300342 RepID=A0A167HAH2_9GAMM|nr:hypothetical protein [Dokdonella koreensis]ANB19732.1 Hypothetical protein I596_3749 [Dokdonella koreensis DS-123]